MISTLRAGNIARFIFCILVLACAAPVSARVSPEYFAAQPRAFAPSLSPSGRYLAIPKRRADETVVITVIDLDAPAGTPASAAALPEKVYFQSVDWGNDDRLLLSFSVLGPYNIPMYRIVAIDRDGKNSKVLFNNKRHMRRTIDLSSVVHTLPDDPQNVLISAYDSGERLALYKVNIVTGEPEEMTRGGKNTVRFMTDLQGVARARWDYSSFRETYELLLRQGDTDDWVTVTKYNKRELPELNIIGFGDDPRTAIVASRQGSDRYALYEFDTAARAQGKAIFQHPAVDVGEPVGGPLYDPYTTKLVGVYYVEDVHELKYFEPDLAAVQSKLVSTFADAAAIRPISWSRDRTRFVVKTFGPKDPGTYYLYDVKKDSVSKVSTRYPGLPPTELGEVLIVKYKSRDGTKIPGYLTMPPGKGDKNLPLVVMPHGGPELRDYVTFEPWAQMLANQGYAVLQPNFRGSAGYGRAFAEAGYRQWGSRMQDDVTDGVNALIKDGTINPNRICIVGASYGGYAALAGGAFTPDLYKCVVSIAGVSDIPLMMEQEEKDHESDSGIYRYWVRQLGDPSIPAELEQMKAASPAMHADKFKVPVLLIHGDKDDVVRIAQSKRMEQAMKAAGKSVEFITIKDEGHHFVAEESDIKVMKEISRFVTTHLGAN